MPTPRTISSMQTPFQEHIFNNILTTTVFSSVTLMLRMSCKERVYWRKISASLSDVTARGERKMGRARGSRLRMRYRFPSLWYLGRLATNVCICNGQRRLVISCLEYICSALPTVSCRNRTIKHPNNRSIATALLSTTGYNSTILHFVVFFIM
jgi:hypothetical protein